MFFDAKFFTLLAFIVINFLILFVVKTRTTTITSLIIAHLVAVLFFSLTISNYNSFKEIVLALIIYSMVVLFLISNYGVINSNQDRGLKTEISKKTIFLLLPFVAIVVTVFFAVFFLAKNTIQITELIQDKKITRQSETMLNPLLMPSHPAHAAVKSFYLDKKNKDYLLSQNFAEVEINERKIARLKDKLSDNFLLKRSSDVILIIVAAVTSLLLLSSKRSEEKQ